MTQLLIVSERDDFHGQLINRLFDSMPGLRSYLLEWDQTAGRPTISWEPHGAVQLLCFENRAVDPRDLDVIWWRRSGAGQQCVPADKAQELLVNRCCSTAVTGVLHASFSGTWISDPSATVLAGNKLVQLAAAKRAGLHVPETCITNDPATVRAFVDERADVIAKSLQPTDDAALFTQLMPRSPLPNGTVLATPTIFQERIDGARHLRVNCFGERVLAFEIVSGHLDWRGKLADAQVRPTEIDDSLAQQLVELQTDLGLAMSVHDLKETPEGRLAWFELNAQGQFLFLQGLTGVDLAAEFVGFLKAVGQQTVGARTPRVAGRV